MLIFANSGPGASYATYLGLSCFRVEVLVDSTDLTQLSGGFRKHRLIENLAWDWAQEEPMEDAFSKW